jgi:UDP-N-acetyl-2-amino-2-deoxyglucuronate dehydrogenase
MEKQHRPLNFALIGVAGYIAERHLRAIKDTGNLLLAALDPFDSVGKMDHYFPEADFFVEFERFDRHIEKIRRLGTKMDYVTICSPNYLHDAHIRFALRHKADAICEKPMVLNPWNIDALAEIERETGKRVYNILQLRLHPSIVQLREKILKGPEDRIYDIDLTYITSRGHWYFISWKGDTQKSGGIATNIGIHFFDMLTWIFGKVTNHIVHLAEPSKASGFFEMERARVRWFLSVDHHDLPTDIKKKDQRTYRSIRINGEEIEFSDGFMDLHTQSYREILAGKGFGIGETRNSIDMAYHIRNASPVGLVGDYHPFCKNNNLRS